MKPEFTREVTEGSKDGTWVLVLLYNDGVPNSALVEAAFTQLARRHNTVKCMKIVSTQCIENYPDRCVRACGCSPTRTHTPLTPTRCPLPCVTPQERPHVPGVP